ncbi:MAG: GTP 3',8-cyclase MoaA [Deinococcus sp.]|nr:GTP 3',8-cyclase MoaA [Deinococcus sp.]
MTADGAKALYDGFGRHINYLRLSLTDHCNLRCVYCMPLHVPAFVPQPDLLTEEEIELVAQAAVGVGFTKFRLTGGEPTLRPEVVSIVRRLAHIPGLGDLAMTTNGLLLPQLAKDLAAAGLRRVNIHLDTLHPERLPQIMRWGTLKRIWAGIEAAEAAGLVPIKLNAVVTRGFNDTDVVDLARLTLERDWHVRFIELMPLGNDQCGQLSRERFVSNVETCRRIMKALGPLTPLPNQNPSDESKNYRLPRARGVVGFISPVSEPYCGSCNRMRLTADGKFHLCLLNDDELDVKAAIRSGGGMAAVQAVLSRAVALKPTGHHLIQQVLVEGASTEQRHMFQIGG